MRRSNDWPGALGAETGAWEGRSSDFTSARYGQHREIASKSASSLAVRSLPQSVFGCATAARSDREWLGVSPTVCPVDKRSGRTPRQGWRGRTQAPRTANVRGPAKRSHQKNVWGGRQGYSGCARRSWRYASASSLAVRSLPQSEFGCAIAARSDREWLGR